MTKAQIAKTARWLHIYLSMISFAVIFFFAATGLTLNHPNWFQSAIKTRELHGTVNPQSQTIPETIRTEQHLHGAPEEPRTDDREISFSYRAPGYSADVVVERDTGAYTVTEVRNGFIAIVNDLHRGQNSGRTWGWLIDASAILLTLVSLTGLLILWFIYKRRTSGLLIAAAGLLIAALIYKVFVP